MAISYLRALPEFRPYMIEVKQGNSKRAKRRNSYAFWKAMSWLKEGHALVVFPSGQIASRRPPWSAHAVEPEWRKSLSLLIRGSKANVLAVSVEGETSPAFQIIRRIHPWTERFMMPREVLAMKDKSLRVTIGEPILYADLQAMGSGRKLVACLRERACELGFEGGDSDCLGETPGETRG